MEFVKLVMCLNFIEISPAQDLSLKVNGFETNNGSLFRYDIGQHLLVECSSTITTNTQCKPRLKLYRNSVYKTTINNETVEIKSSQYIISNVIRDSYFIGGLYDNLAQLRCSLEWDDDKWTYNIMRYLTLDLHKPTSPTDISLKINGEEFGNSSTYEYSSDEKINVRCSTTRKVKMWYPTISVDLYTVNYYGYKITHGQQNYYRFKSDYETYYIDVMNTINQLDDGLKVFCGVTFQWLLKTESHKKFVVLKRIIPVISLPAQSATKGPDDGQFYSNVTTNNKSFNRGSPWFKAVWSGIVLITTVMIVLCITRVLKKKRDMVNYENIKGGQTPHSSTTTFLEDTCTISTDTEAIYANTQPDSKAPEELYSKPIPKAERNRIKEVQYVALHFENNTNEVVFKNVTSSADETTIAGMRQSNEPTYAKVQEDVFENST